MEILYQMFPYKIAEYRKIYQRYDINIIIFIVMANSPKRYFGLIFRRVVLSSKGAEVSLLFPCFVFFL